MIGEAKLKQLHEFLGGYSKEELIWINGYLSGIVNGGFTQSSGHTPAVQKIKISLVYGTETGNAQRLAIQLAAVAKKRGVQLRLQSLDQYRLTDLEKEEYFFIVISTQGEGEPPVNGKKFYDYIHATPLRLPELKFGVLALGDSSYPLFCKTGEDVDRQLNLAGATRTIPLRKCDVDYEEDAASWFEQVLSVTGKQENNKLLIETPATVKKTSGKKYYKGTVLKNINLNDRGSAKSTWHIELGTAEQIEYEPGDALGIIPQNREEVVKQIIALAGVDGAKPIQTAKHYAPLTELLTKHLTICYLLTSTIKKYAAITGHEIPDTRMDLVDLLRIYPVKNSGQFEDFVQVLMPVAPRLYSVSSSPAAHGTAEIHITVARNRFLAMDEQRFGLCSEFLGDVPVGTTLQFYIHKNRGFKLPSPERDIIMIGPGTGVAPFRSFIAERDSTGATGKNWFFFGEQHFQSDFLYQAEMQQYLQTGTLTHIDLAFSRDQPEKIYVQQRMQQKAAELYKWINNGATVYISGTKNPMSRDVETTLLSILEEQGRMNAEEAKQYLAAMEKEGRYEKDVY